MLQDLSCLCGRFIFLWFLCNITSVAKDAVCNILEMLDGLEAVIDGLQLVFEIISNKKKYNKKKYDNENLKATQCFTQLKLEGYLRILLIKSRATKSIQFHMDLGYVSFNFRI